jgi:hypothetical protein
LGAFSLHGIALFSTFWEKVKNPSTTCSEKHQVLWLPGLVFGGEKAPSKKAFLFWLCYCSCFKKNPLGGYFD